MRRLLVAIALALAAAAAASAPSASACTPPRCELAGCEIFLDVPRADLQRLEIDPGHMGVDCTINPGFGDEDPEDSPPSRDPDDRGQ